MAKEEMLASGNAEQAIAKATAHIESQTSGKIDYLECLSYPDLAPINDKTTDVLLAAAVYIGKTRLIDNLMFSPKEK